MSKKAYEVVKQADKGYYTIFLFDTEQYCDKDGTPIIYETYEEAQEDCDELNALLDYKETKYGM